MFCITGSANLISFSRCNNPIDSNEVIKMAKGMNVWNVELGTVLQMLAVRKDMWKTKRGTQSYSMCLFTAYATYVGRTQQLTEKLLSFSTVTDSSSNNRPSTHNSRNIRLVPGKIFAIPEFGVQYYDQHIIVCKALDLNTEFRYQHITQTVHKVFINVPSVI